MHQFSWWRRKNYQDAKALPDGFLYSSNNNDRWLTLSQLKNMAREFSTPFEQTGSPGSFKATGYPTKRVIHKTKSRGIAPAKNIDHGNNIPT
jgi:hypothetical protein